VSIDGATHVNMNGDRPTSNGEQRMSNGIQQDGTTPASQAASLKVERLPQKSSIPFSDRDQGHVNGQSSDAPLRHPTVPHTAISYTEQAPLEILQLISKDSYLPLAALVSRAAQACWNSLSVLLEQLTAIHVSDHNGESTKSLPSGQANNQSKANLEKKEKLLLFANDQKADFIKLLVLLQWSRDVDDVSKTISINYWLMTRRQAYWDAIASLVLIKQDSAGFQVPNPDLKTAAEILARGRAIDIPTLGYIPQKDLSSKQILHVLKSLNRLLSIRLALSQNLPPALQNFRIHDGRATFIIPNEFEMDVSILDDSLDSQFRMVDFRFTFSPAPSISDGMRAEIERFANSNIERDGLQGCYLFLQELVLSFKLAEYHKQALELARTQWAGNLRVELIRRTLVVQYWSSRQTAKSWIEIGIASSHHPSESSGNLPHLDMRWTRHGQLVASPVLSIAQPVLSLEDILRQVIAQDSTLLIDDIYDNLNSTPLFANGDLSLQQTLSAAYPEDCALTIQLSRSSQLELKIDSVTGSFVISPVTEKSERLQYEINRAHGVGGEIASKLLNFRCSVLESAISTAMLGTNWELLRAFKFTQPEIKSLFGGPVVRLNLFRKCHWGSDYFLAISHTHSGDQWWLLHQTELLGSSGKGHFQVIRNQKINIKHRLGSAYFDRLCEYATGLIFLRRNAEYLKLRNDVHDLPPFPDFEHGYKLPELSFRLDGFRSKSPIFDSNESLAILEDEDTGGRHQKAVNVRFDGVDPGTNLATVIGKIQIGANADILQHLNRSTLDPDVSLNPNDHSATIRVDTSVTEAAIPTILDKAVHLKNMISTVRQIYRLPGLALQSLSKSGFSVCYYNAPPKELSVQVSFRDSGQAPQLAFFPREDNPHSLLAEKYSDILVFERHPFETRVHNFLTSLIMTYPLVSYLHNLQKQYGQGVKEDQGLASIENRSQLRIHVLVRTAQHFAIQYFTNVNHSSKDAGPESHTNLVARLEILPHVDSGSKKPMWLVRAAMEEFQAYSRPSFSSTALRMKLRQGIFSRTEAPTKWLTLDTAAACLADNPEPLLQEIHDLLMSFVKDQNASQAGKDVSSKADTQKTQPGGVSNGNIKSKPQPRPQGKMQAPAAGPNGILKQPPQRVNNPAARTLPAKAHMKSSTPNNQDNPITLD
jgi:mediator of RNA polymerase II transcription subunit 14